MNYGFVRTATALCCGIAGRLLTPALAHSQVYLTQYGNSIGSYALDGTPINPLLLPYPRPLTLSLATSGGSLFAAIYAIAMPRISEYDANTGAVLHDPLIGGILPSALAIRGEDMFVTHFGGVGHFTTSGATVNATLIPDVDGRDIVVSGDTLWVASGPSSSGTVGKYSTSGATIDASLVTGLQRLAAIAVSDGKLYVLDGGTEGVPAAIGVYDADTGAPINPSLVTALDSSNDMAIFGGNLYITQSRMNRVSLYSAAGELLNAQFIFADSPHSITIIPEPSPIFLLLIGAAVLCGFHVRRIKAD